MKGSARLSIDRSGAIDMYAEPPFAIRRCADQFIVVGSAAAPVGGDELDLAIVVAEGASARVTTAAATMLWPAPNEVVPSAMTTSLSVHAHSHLTWWPEPSVSVAGSHHLARTTLILATGASCVVVEELALGRHAESPGFVDAVLRVEREGVVLVHHAEEYGFASAGWGNAVGTGSARHVFTAVMAGMAEAGAPRTDVGDDVSAAWLPIAEDVVVVLAVGPDRPSVLALVRQLAPELTR